MKILIYVLVGAGVCATWGVSLAMAYGAGAKTAFDTALRKAGYSRATVKLHNRAARILNRLAARTDLDGAMAGDQLSPESRKLVTDWVTDYKREINKA